MKLILSTAILAASSFGYSSEIGRAGVQQAFTKDNHALGYTVRYIGKNPQFEKAGVQVGDVLQYVCGMKLDNMNTYIKADQALMRGDKSCEIILLRNNERITLTVDAN
jgi:C-terminal processing protease CtpA/Prc